MNNSEGSRKLAAVFLIGLGGLFLAAQIFNFSIFGILWPFFIILPGAAFLYAAMTGDRSRAGMAIPGAMITGTGAILLYQSITNHWASWAYIWALYPVFFGLALSFVGRRTANENTYHAGGNFVKFGLIGFIGFWALFELFIFGGSIGLLATLVPLALIAAGGYLLLRRNTDTAAWSKPKKRKTAPYQGNYTSAADINPELRRKIDEALAEPDEAQAKDN